MCHNEVSQAFKGFKFPISCRVFLPYGFNHYVMPEIVTYQEEKDLIKVNSFQEVTPSDFKNTITSILSLSWHHQCSRVLVDALEVSSYPDLFPIYSFGSLVGEKLNKIKIAILTKKEKIEETRFFQNAVTKHGGSVNLFDSKEDALEWLKQRPMVNFAGV